MFKVWGAKRPLLEDRLNLEAVTDDDGWLHGCGGLPSASDSCAYEPIQKLLAVGTWDGRVKVYGRQGVECTIYSACHYAYSTRQLDFLTNRGILVRLSEGGFLEAWSLSGGQDVRSSKREVGGITDLCSIKLDGDYIACFTSMRTEPFMLMGTGQGHLRFGALVGPQGSVVPQLKQPTNIRLLPYKVTAEELRGSGELHQLAVRSIGPQHLVFALHFTSGLCLWDLRARSVVAHLNPFSKEAPNQVLRKAGRITAVSWLTPTLDSLSKGSDRPDFITGHNAGDILVWRLPNLSETSNSPDILSMRRIVPSGAEPVKSLTAVTVCKRQAVVVMGGQPEDVLDGIAVLAVDEKADPPMQALASQSGYDAGTDEDEDGQAGKGGIAAGTIGSGAPLVKLPRDAQPLGYFPLPAPGSIPGFQDADCVVQFQEGPQLFVNPIGGRQAVPGKRQQLPGLQGHDGEITCTAAYVIPYQRSGSHPLHILTVSGLLHAQPEGGVGVTWQEELAQAIAGGIPPKPDASQCLIYLTGYKNGFVDIWHMSGEQPQLLASAPSVSVVAAKLGRSSLKSVTALDLATHHGIMCTGHAKGEVRVYQFNPKSRPVNIVTLKADPAAELKSVQVFDDAGMQLRLRCVANEAEVVAVSCAPSGTYVVAGDKSGSVCVIDMTQPALLWCLTPVPQPCTDVVITTIPAPCKRDRSPGTLDANVKDGAPIQVVVLVSADSCVGLLHLETGNFLGKNGELKPKSRSWALFCEPLDDMYRPVWSSGAGSQPLKGKAAKKPAVGSWRAKLQGGGRGLREYASDTEDSSSEHTDSELDELNDSGGGGNSSKPHEATHMLLVSTEAIRVYAMSGVLIADRTTLTKVTPPYPLIWASTFMAGSAPGLVALAQPADGSDPVFMIGQPPVQWACPPGSAKARRSIAATHQGHLFLLAEAKELLQLHITPALPSIVLPTGLYDTDIAAAAHAAAAAHERTLLATIANAERRAVGGASRLQSAGPSAVSGGSVTASNGLGAATSLTGGSDEDDVEAELEAVAKRGASGIGGVLTKMTYGMTKVVEATGKGLVNMATKGVEGAVEGVREGIKGVGRLFNEEEEDALTAYNNQVPSLLWVLGQTAPPERTKSRKNKKQEEEDGIPVTNPQAIVLPDNLPGPPPPRPVATRPKLTIDTATSSSPRSPGTSSARLEVPSDKAYSLPTTKSERVQHTTHTYDADGDHDEYDSVGTAAPHAEDEHVKRTAKWKRKALLAAAFVGERAGRRKSVNADIGGGGGGGGGDSAMLRPDPAAMMFSKRAPAKATGARDARDGGDSSEYEDYSHTVKQHSGSRGGGGISGGGASGASGPSFTGGGGVSREASASGGTPGVGEVMVSGATKLAQDMKSGLKTGASALVGKMSKLGDAGSSTIKERVDEDNEETTRKKRMAEIYAKYQRAAPKNSGGASSSAASANAKAQGIRDVVLEARSKLVERGEKLGKMETDAEAMSNEAAGFADLAKQLMEQQKNRKWWQM